MRVTNNLRKTNFSRLGIPPGGSGGGYGGLGGYGGGLGEGGGGLKQTAVGGTGEYK